MKRVVLVTGASSGIGREIVRKLASDYEVIIHYNNSERDAFILKEEIDKLYDKDVMVCDYIKRNNEPVVINQYGRIKYTD